MKFTDKFILSLKPKDKIYQVRENDGFGIRVLPSGLKIFIFVYTFDGQRRQMNLGSYPEISLAEARVAHAAAYALLKNKQNPVDPQTERDIQLNQAKINRDENRKAPTVAMLIDDYIERYAKIKKKSWREDQRILTKDVLPVWGDRKAKSISRRDVLEFLDNMQIRGDGITTNTYKIIRKMFNFAVKKEILSSTPCYLLERGEDLPIPISRDRTLNEEEVVIVWNGIDHTAMSNEIKRILKLILLTGQRPGEVAAMASNEISGRWWEFSPKETSVTKQLPRLQRIYLTDTALDLIGRIPDRGYIFKGRNKPDSHTTERAVSHALRRHILGYEPQRQTTAKQSGVTKKARKPYYIPDEKKLTIAHFVPHDLRRTCATFISQLGFRDDIVDAVLAHLKKGEIRTYNKNKYDDEKKAAMERWESKLLDLAGCQASSKANKISLKIHNSIREMISIAQKQ